MRLQTKGGGAQVLAHARLQERWTLDEVEVRPTYPSLRKRGASYGETEVETGILGEMGAQPKPG